MKTSNIVLGISFLSFAYTIFSADTDPDVAAGRLACIKSFLNTKVTNLALSPKGDLLAAVQSDKLKVWKVADMDTQKPLLEIKESCNNHHPRAEAISFHPTDETFATGCNHGCIRIYNQDGEELNYIPTEDKYIADVSLDSTKKHIFDLLFHPTKKHVAISRGYGAVEVWDLEQKNRLTKVILHPHPIIQLAYDISGETITALHTHGVVNTINFITNDKEEYTTTWPYFNYKDNEQVWTDKHGRYIVHGNRDGSITLSDLSKDASYKPVFKRTAQQLGSTEIEFDQFQDQLPKEADLNKIELLSYTTNIAAVGIDSRHKRMLIGLQQGEVLELLWKTSKDGESSCETRQLQAAIEDKNHKNTFWPIRTDDKGQYFVTLMQAGNEIRQIVTSADGSHFASASRDGRLSVWKVLMQDETKK